jgi:hypothetical protein
MRKGLILFFFATGATMISNGAPESDTARPAAVFPREEFLNQVFRTVVDSSLSNYYLYAEAMPCSFVKYDYEEWAKYALQEDVPIYLLNELAEKCYHDRAPSSWRQDSLSKAVCLGAWASDSIGRLPAQEKPVFYFSRPEFTDDGQYAIIDLGFQCGAHCGRSATYLFRRTGAGQPVWKMIGRRLNWVS